MSLSDKIFGSVEYESLFVKDVKEFIKEFNDIIGDWNNTREMVLAKLKVKAGEKLI